MEINTDLRLQALEVADEVADAIAETGNEGLSIKDLSRLLGMDYTAAYATAIRLEDFGKIMLCKGYNGIRLINHTSEPSRFRFPPLTPLQARLLAFLVERSDESSLVRVSFKQMQRALGHKSTLSATIDGLDRRGHLEIIDRGDCHRARLYKIFKDGDGPQGFSAVWYGPPRPTFNVLRDWFERREKGE